jgi:hypothetical protein
MLIQNNFSCIQQSRYAQRFDGLPEALRSEFPQRERGIRGRNLICIHIN